MVILKMLFVDRISFTKSFREGAKTILEKSAEPVPFIIKTKINRGAGMARSLRIRFSDVFYHIISRGI